MNAIVLGKMDAPNRPLCSSFPLPLRVMFPLIFCYSENVSKALYLNELSALKSLNNPWRKRKTVGPGKPMTKNA